MKPKAVPRRSADIKISMICRILAITSPLQESLFCSVPLSKGYGRSCNQSYDQDNKHRSIVINPILSLTLILFY